MLDGNNCRANNDPTLSTTVRLSCGDQRLLTNTEPAQHILRVMSQHVPRLVLSQQTRILNRGPSSFSIETEITAMKFYIKSNKASLFNPLILNHTSAHCSVLPAHFFQNAVNRENYLVLSIMAFT